MPPTHLGRLYSVIRPFLLIFYRETKSNDKGEGFSAKLWSIDLTGYNERQVQTEPDASDPSWSSLLSN